MRFISRTPAQFYWIRRCLIRYPGMRKLRHNNCSTKRSVKFNGAAKTDVAKPKLDSIDEDEQGFGGWLRSAEGLENMKLFVIANSIVLLTTLVYPHIQIVFEIISDVLYGADGII